MWSHSKRNVVSPGFHDSHEPFADSKRQGCCRVAPLTSLAYVGLKGREAIETVHLGIAVVLQGGRVDYTIGTISPSLF